jgi:hypothetical protein
MNLSEDLLRGVFEYFSYAPRVVGSLQMVRPEWRQAAWSTPALHGGAVGPHRVHLNVHSQHAMVDDVTLQQTPEISLAIANEEQLASLGQQITAILERLEVHETALHPGRKRRTWRLGR